MSTLSTSPALPRGIQRRNRRIEQYRDLVRPIALHYQQRCAEPLDDLIQVGLLGLLRAAELYRPDTSTPFSAFARPHVRGAILHYLRDLAAPVRLPRRLEERRQQLGRLRRQWPCRGASEPSDEQLRQAMGLNQRQWLELERCLPLQKPLSLDEALMEKQQQMGSDVDVSPAGGNSGGESRGPDATELLSQLEEPLRAVVERVVLAGWSYRRTAEVLQVSPMTVQRRLRRGLEQLRQLLNPGAAGPRLAASGVPGC
jgi:RNA polymerase sigma-B factor